MKFRKTVEIGVMIFGEKPFLPKLQPGQYVTVNGQRGRWIGVSRAGTIWIAWPKTAGVNINEKIRIMNERLAEMNNRGLIL